MKKIYLLLFTSLILIFSSCKKENIEKCECGEVIKKVSYPGNAFGGPIHFQIKGHCGKIKSFGSWEIIEYLPEQHNTPVGRIVCIPEEYW